MEDAKNSNEIKVADWMTETVLSVEIYDSISNDPTSPLFQARTISATFRSR